MLTGWAGPEVGNTWVTATALSTALNVSYMAEQMALFGIVVGVALLLSGFGFIVLALGGVLRQREWAPLLKRQQKGAREPATAVSRNPQLVPDSRGGSRPP